MAARSKGAEVKAGIVVLIGLAILAAGMFWVSGGSEQFEDKAYYTVYFENGGQIASGHTVYLAGQKAGSVTGVGIVDLERGGKKKPHVAVEIKVGKDDRIYEDCEFGISQTVTGIVSMRVDYGDESETLATSKSMLFGKRLDTFEEAIDKGSRLLDTAGEGLEEFNALLSDARKQVNALDLARIQGKVEGVLDKADSAAGNADELLTTVKADWSDKMQPKIQETLDNTADLTGRVKKDWSEALEPRLEKALDHGDEFLVEARDVVRDNRERIKSIFQQADDAMRRVPKVLATIETMTRNLDRTVTEVRPKLVKTMDRAKGAMANFQAVTEDLKTAPWKLVNKPSDDESDAVHLYNASRLYVEAASRIGDNLEDIETLERLGALEDPESKELVEKVLQSLNRSLDEFELRQRRLIDRIQGTAK